MAQVYHRRYHLGVLVGRDAECSAINSLIAAARVSNGGALVLRGEAGVGKTALLRYAADNGRRHARAARRGRGVGGRPAVLRPPPGAARGPRHGSTASHPRRPPRCAGPSASVGRERRRPLPDLASAPSGCWPTWPRSSRCSWWWTTPSGSTARPRRRWASPRGGWTASRWPCSSRRARARRAGFEAAGVPELPLRGPRPRVGAGPARRRGPRDGAARGRAARRPDRGQPARPGRAAPLLGAGQLSGRVPLPEHLPLTSEVEHAFLDRARRASARARAPCSASRPPTRPGDVPTVVAGARRAAGCRRRRPGGGRGVGPDPGGSGDRVELRHPLARSALHRGLPYPMRQSAHRALADVLTRRERTPTGGPGTGPRPASRPTTRSPRTRWSGPPSAPAPAAATRPRRRPWSARRGSAPTRPRGCGGWWRRPSRPSQAGRAPLAQALADEAEARLADDALRARILRAGPGIAELRAAGRPRRTGLLLDAAEAADADDAGPSASSTCCWSPARRRRGRRSRRRRWRPTTRRAAGGRGRRRGPDWLSRRRHACSRTTSRTRCPRCGRLGGQRRHRRPAPAGVERERRHVARRYRSRRSRASRAPSSAPGRGAPSRRSPSRSLAAARSWPGSGGSHDAWADGEEALRLTEEAGPREQRRPGPRGARDRRRAARRRRRVPGRGGPRDSLWPRGAGCCRCGRRRPSPSPIWSSAAASYEAALEPRLIAGGDDSGRLAHPALAATPRCRPDRTPPAGPGGRRWAPPCSSGWSSGRR